MFIKLVKIYRFDNDIVPLSVSKKEMPLISSS